MNGRLRAGLLAFVAFALAALPLQPNLLEAQEASARFRVMVPRLLPGPDTGDNFGEDLAEELRDLINDMPTHQPVDEDDIEDAMDRFDLDWEDLNCARARQLAQQIQAEVVFCGTYVREGEQFNLHDMKFIDSNGEEFLVEDFSTPRRDGEEEAAQTIFESLEVMVNQIRYAQFCAEYFQSQQWESALTNCNRAIELNPNSVGSRYIRAVVLRNLERLEESLAEFERVLELEPIHESAMQNAGYLSAKLGQDDQAREYYSNYLELNPANSQVRMSVAYDLADAGDPLGAMQLLEEGLELDAENTDLLTRHAGFAYAAAQELNSECQAEAEAAGNEPAEVCPGPEAAELFRKAVGSFEAAFEVAPDELEPAQLRSMVGAFLNLDENQEAVAIGEKILETRPDVPQVWSIYADALKRSGRLEEALEALNRVAELDPEFAASSSVAARQGQWLLEEGRLDDAVEAFRRSIELGEQSPDRVANFFFARGYTDGVEPKNWDHAIRLFRHAKEFDVSDAMAEQVNFWLGFALLNRAAQIQEPATLETAEQTLPDFQRALELFQSASEYAQQNNLESTRQELITNTNTYIEIQEAIIARGR